MFVAFVPSNSCVRVTGGVVCQGSNTVSLIDGTLRRTCRPGGEDEIQEKYDGHHRAHNVAVQSLIFAHGLLELWGPVVWAAARPRYSHEERAERQAVGGASGEAVPV